MKHTGMRSGHMLMHVALVAWVAGMLWLATARPESYNRAMQEDGFVEWLTVFLFLAAAVASFVVRKAHGRFGDLMIALFCIFAAGEEISWGQRIFAYVPAETFLARNEQQEANLHNLVEAFGQPKWSLIAILVGYGILLPLLARIPATAKLLDRTRTTAPELPVAVWFVIAILIEIIYPVSFTGEWAETLVGALFLWGISRSPKFTVVGGVVATLLAAAASAASAHSSSSEQDRITCARSEVALIRDAMLTMGYPPERGGRMHRRLGMLWPDSRVDRTVRAALDSARCTIDEAARQARRHDFGIDPWGNAYWVRIERDSSGSSLLRVYSMGANRRRDHDRIGAPSGDDINADAVSRR